MLRQTFHRTTSQYLQTMGTLGITKISVIRSLLLLLLVPSIFDLDLPSLKSTNLRSSRYHRPCKPAAILLARDLLLMLGAK